MDELTEIVESFKSEKQMDDLVELQEKRKSARLELEKCKAGTPHYNDLERCISNLTKKIKRKRKEMGSDL